MLLAVGHAALLTIHQQVNLVKYIWSAFSQVFHLVCHVMSCQASCIKHYYGSSTSLSPCEYLRHSVTTTNNSHSHLLISLPIFCHHPLVIFTNSSSYSYTYTSTTVSPVSNAALPSHFFPMLTCCSVCTSSSLTPSCFLCTSCYPSYRKSTVCIYNPNVSAMLLLKITASMTTWLPQNFLIALAFRCALQICLQRCVEGDSIVRINILAFKVIDETVLFVRIPARNENLTTVTEIGHLSSQFPAYC
jgi:hypothetical protein